MLQEDAKVDRRRFLEVGWGPLEGSEQKVDQLS